MQTTLDFGNIDFKYIAFVGTIRQLERENVFLKEKALKYQHKYGAKITHAIKLKKNGNNTRNTGC